MTPPKSEGPEVAASEPSVPTATKEQIGNSIMAQPHDTSTEFDPDASVPDDLLPVNSDYFACCHAIGEHGPDCRVRVLHRLRAAVAEVDPAMLTARDARSLIDLLDAAARSDSLLGRHVRAQDPHQIHGGQR